MLISKTLFKEYTRCPRVSALDDLYKKKISSSVSLLSDEKNERIFELLGSMFSDSGDDLIYPETSQVNALLDYYDNVEKYAMEFCERKFNIPIHYAKETKDQKSFSYTDKNRNQFYCYVDGYYEDDNEIYIFEVKATTATKFFNLGPKRKNARASMKGLAYYNSIFEFNEDDILVLKENISDELTIDKFESNYRKLFNRYSDVGRYVYDLAIERNIVENSLLQDNYLHHKKINYYLVVLNSDYVFDGNYIDGEPIYNTDQNGNDLFVVIDMNRVTFEYQEQIEESKGNLLNYINNLDANTYPLGRYCERKEDSRCPFFNICWEKATKKGSILEYFYQHNGFTDVDGGKHQTINLINAGLDRMDSIPREWLKREDNIIQLDCYLSNSSYINVDKIRKGLGLITYPIYHLDFESFPCPLPRYKGESPYSQSVFQFSIHIEKAENECDLLQDNYSFLALDHNDNRKELVRKLVQIIDLSNGGTVLVYNKSFEYSRINEFIQFYPEYKLALEKINSHMFDLIDLIKSNKRLYLKEFDISEEEAGLFNYYHPDLEGSFSIKKVLPLFSNLSYDDLAVRNGSDALATYASYPKYKSEDLEEIYEQLIEYCRQDTWAMVLILNGLRKLTK